MSSAPDPSTAAQKTLSTVANICLKTKKATPLYTIGLFFVTLMMIVLPLIYLGIIIGCGYGVYYHAVHSLLFLSDMNWHVAFLAYFGPLAVGGIGILFLVKPLFVRPPATPKPWLLDRENDVELAAFIDGVADAVGASRPSVIEIDLNVNAAAAFRRGLLSVFSNDLKLILGLPLICGMSERSMGGILAHEFGHFSQGVGMRLTYIIRSINAWFSRVVYDRDRLDVWLDRTARKIDLRIGIILHLARLFVWLARRILWCLMWLGNVISCFALRQMEYDADSFEAQFAGSGHYKKTCERMYQLGAGYERAIGLIQETFQQGFVSDDLAGLTVMMSNRLDPTVLSSIQEHLNTKKTHLFDTHPSDKDRIRAAMKLNYPGVYTVEEPALHLLRDPSEFFRKATIHYYEAVAEIKLGEENLLSNAELLDRETEMIHEMESLRFFFKDRLNLQNPLLITAADLQAPPEEKELHVFKEEVDQLDDQLDLEFKTLNEQRARKNKITAAQTLLIAGFQINASSFGEQSVLESDPETHARSMDETSARVSIFYDRAKRFLLSAITADKEAEGKCIYWIKILEELNGLLPAVHQLEDLVFSSEILYAQVQDDELQRPHYTAIVRTSQKINQLMASMRPALEALPYPFAQAHGQTNLWEAIQPESLDNKMDQTYRSFICGQCAVSQLFRLYVRVLGQLCITGKTVFDRTGNDTVECEK